MVHKPRWIVEILTSFYRFVDRIFDRALIRVRKLLGLEVHASGAEAAAVHGRLERSSFPAEYIIGVLTVAGAVHRISEGMSGKVHKVLTCHPC